MAEADSNERELSVSEAILGRRSAKQFVDRPLPFELVNRILELTRAAPSSFNLQPWRIVVVRDPAQRRALAAAAYHQPQFENAPVTLVFAVTITGWRDHFESVVTSGVESGAWPREFEQTIRNSIAGFQDGLNQHNQLREYAIKDAMIASTHAVLAAQSLGVASCFMNGWEEAAVKRVIGAGDDDDVAIAVLLPLGYTTSEPLSPGRLAAELTVFEERLPS